MTSKLSSDRGVKVHTWIRIFWVCSDWSVAPLNAGTCEQSLSVICPPHTQRIAVRQEQENFTGNRPSPAKGKWQEAHIVAAPRQLWNPLSPTWGTKEVPWLLPVFLSGDGVSNHCSPLLLAKPSEIPLLVHKKWPIQSAECLFSTCFLPKNLFSFWTVCLLYLGEGNGTPLQYSCLENPMDGGAWWATVHGVAKSRTLLSDFTFTFHFHAVEKEMATHSSVLAWRIPETGELGGLPSLGSHRVWHDWSDLAAAAVAVFFI